MMISIGGRDTAFCAGAKAVETPQAKSNPEVANAQSTLKSAGSNEIAQAQSALKTQGAAAATNPQVAINPQATSTALPGQGVGTETVAEIIRALIMLSQASNGGNAGITTVGGGTLNNNAPGFTNVSPQVINQAATGQAGSLANTGLQSQVQQKGGGAKMVGNGQGGQFTIFGQAFAAGAGQTQGQAKHVRDGITAEEHTRRGVEAHEKAHQQVARSYGIDTGSVVLERDGDLYTGGHVELRPQLAWDANRARSDKNYLAAFRKQAEGMVASAEAPQNVIAQYGAPMSGLDSNGYGKLSDADKQISSKWRGYLAQAQQMG
jgi:hypothetical protein